jgi:hypothetical protein
MATDGHFAKLCCYKNPHKHYWEPLDLNLLDSKAGIGSLSKHYLYRGNCDGVHPNVRIHTIPISGPAGGI